MTLMDPLMRLNSDCVSLVFKFLSPKDVLQCLRVCRQWRDDIHSWIERVGFRVHCCPILFDGEDVDLVAYYKRYAQRDTNLVMGQPTSVRRLGWCKQEPQQAGRYLAWVGADEYELRWERRSSSPGSQDCSDNNDSGDVDGWYKSMKLLSPLQSGVAVCHLNAAGQLLAWSSLYLAIIYDFSDAEYGDNPHDQRSDSNHKVAHWETPARWSSFEHSSKLLGASHVFSMDSWGSGQELAAHGFRDGKLAYHIQYPATDEYAPGALPAENSESGHLWPRALGGPELITLHDGREILLQIQWLKPDGPSVINVIDGATGARMQRLRCGGSGSKTLEVLPPRCRKGEAVHSFRVVSIVRIRKHQKHDPHPPLLVVVQSFAYTERPNKESECIFQSVGFNSFILPKGVKTIALHPMSCVGFTIPNPQTGSPLGVFHLAQSFDTRLEVEIKNLTKELHFETFKEAPNWYFSITGPRDIENLMKPGDKCPWELRSFTDGRLMVSSLRSMSVKILDFE